MRVRGGLGFGWGKPSGPRGDREPTRVPSRSLARCRRSSHLVDSAGRAVARDDVLDPPVVDVHGRGEHLPPRHDPATVKHGGRRDVGEARAVEEHHLLLQEEHEHRADRDERGGEGVHHLRTTVGGGRGDEVWLGGRRRSGKTNNAVEPEHFAPGPDRAFRRVGRQ